MIGVGDLVVCVGGEGRSCSCGGPHAARIKGVKRGRAYRVAAITPHCRCASGNAIQLVGIANSAPHIGFCCARFRKIRPDEHEPCEQEFRILLNLSKRRVKSGEPA